MQYHTPFLGRKCAGAHISKLKDKVEKIWNIYVLIF
jgi:hypothetical protein